MKSQEILKIVGAVVLICAGLGVFYWQTTQAQAEHVANWGVADAKEININSKVSGRVIEILVDEGDSVKQGQILARIDKDFQEPQQRQAQAAEAQLNRAETALKLAAKNEARYRELFSASAISAQTYDVYKTQLEDAQAAYNAAQANVESARVSLIKNDENKAAQAALREQIDALQSQLDSVNLNIKETEVNKYKIGDKITLTGRDGKLKIDGTVESIRRKADFATQKATSERGETDIIAFNLKIRTNNDAVWSGMRFSLGD